MFEVKLTDKHGNVRIITDFKDYNSARDYGWTNTARGNGLFVSFTAYPTQNKADLS